MPYNVANNGLLHAMQESPPLKDGFPRFVIMGSTARAAILGLPISAFDTNDPARFQDIDIVDRLGVIATKIHFPDGSILDGTITRFFRPAPIKLDKWRLQDPLGSTSHSYDIDAKYLGLGFHQMRENGLDILTPDAWGMLAFQAASNHLHTKMWRKHPKQMDALQNNVDHVPLTAERRVALEGLASAAMLIKERQKLTSYEKVRKCLFNLFPNVAQIASDSNIGKIVRLYRGTQRRSPPNLDIHKVLTAASADELLLTLIGAY